MLYLLWSGEEHRRELPLSVASAAASAAAAVDILKMQCITIAEAELNRQYVTKGDLGKGAFGSVALVADIASRKLCALKRIPKPSPTNNNNTNFDPTQTLLREVQIQSQCHHPHIIELFKVFKTDVAYYLLMQHCSNKDLHHRIFGATGNAQPLPEPLVRKYFQQLMEGVAYLHLHCHVAHGDLKPANLLLDFDDNLLIGDLGIARALTDTIFATAARNVQFVSPEVARKLRGNRSNNAYNKACDLWSCGTILHVMLSRKYLFDGVTEDQICNNICNGKYEIATNIPAGAQSLIKKLCELDPMKRATLHDVFNDPWFLQGYMPSNEHRALLEQFPKLQLAVDNKQER